MTNIDGDAGVTRRPSKPVLKRRGALTRLIEREIFILF